MEANPDLLLTVVFLCAFCYVLIYGKTCDWYASPAIRAGTAIGLCALLLKEAASRAGTYLDLHVFTYRNVWIGMLLFLVTVIANYGSTLMVSYIKAASAADNLHGATLSLWCVLGCVLGRPTTSTARPSPCGVSLAVCSAVRCLS